jgi:hypothetical protein
MRLKNVFFQSMSSEVARKARHTRLLLRPGISEAARADLKLEEGGTNERPGHCSLERIRQDLPLTAFSSWFPLRQSQVFRSAKSGIALIDA